MANFQLANLQDSTHRIAQVKNPRHFGEGFLYLGPLFISTTFQGLLCVIPVVFFHP